MTDDPSSAKIEVYEGHHDDVPDHDPEWSETVALYTDDWWGSTPSAPPHDAETATLSDSIEFNSGPIEIYVEADQPVVLFVHSNDSYHSPDDWGRPAEGGLLFGPEIDSTYGCEIWGRVVMWVAERDPNE